MNSELFTGCNHIGIYVANREEAIRFYSDVFGFKLLFCVDVESDGEHIGMLQLGNCMLEVLEPAKDKQSVIPAAVGTLNHFALNVPDIETALKHVESFGYIAEEEGIYDVPGFGSPDLNLKVAFFRGPNGERLELFQEIHL